MKLGMFLPSTPDHRWKLAAQAGVKNAICKLLPPQNACDLDSLAAVKKQFEDAGFRLCALEGDQLDMSRIKLGLPGREEDFETYRRLLRNMGALGIPLLCYNFMAGVGWFRSRNDIPDRGGALTSGFFPSDVPDLPLKFSHEKLWENYETFIRAVLPEAERSGVRMGLHPDDPPVPVLKGYPRIFTNADAYRRMLKITASPNAGITFCAATFRTMGENVPALLKEFRDHIYFVHLRDNRNVRDGFQETFHDDGPTDMPELFRTFRSLGMDVLLRPDHAPTMEGESNSDPGYAAMGRVFAIGYFRGIIQSLEKESSK